MNAKTSIIGLTLEELSEKLTALGMEKFRAKQVWSWMYAKGATEFSQMSSIAKKSQTLLDEHFTLARPKIARALDSIDGTKKWLLEFDDGNKIESVFIPEE